MNTARPHLHGDSHPGSAVSPSASEGLEEFLDVFSGGHRLQTRPCPSGSFVVLCTEG